MKKYLLPVLAFSILPLSAVADEGFYLGLKAGTVTVDEEEIDDLKNTNVDIDDSSMGGMLIGYNFNTNVAIELDVSGSEHDLENVPGYDTMDLGLVGLYVAYRSEGQFYFKGRAGLLSRSIDLNAINPANPFTPDLDDSDSSLSIGLGGGVRVEQFSFEAEFTTVEAGINTFGVAAIYNF